MPLWKPDSSSSSQLLAVALRSKQRRTWTDGSCTTSSSPSSSRRVWQHIGWGQLPSVSLQCLQILWESADPEGAQGGVVTSGGLHPAVRRSWASPVLWPSPRGASPGWPGCRSCPAWCGCGPAGCRSAAYRGVRAPPRESGSGGGPAAPAEGGCGCAGGHESAASPWPRGSWGWGWRLAGWAAPGGARCTGRPGRERRGPVRTLRSRGWGWPARCSAAAGGGGWWRPAKRIWCSECTGLGHTERRTAGREGPCRGGERGESGIGIQKTQKQWKQEVRGLKKRGGGD